MPTLFAVMPSAERVLIVVLALSITLVSAGPTSFYRHQFRRNIISEKDLADSYDFIIAGGGTAGLALASRLTEDSDTTVLVLEAGKSGNDVAEQVSHPGNTYYDSLTNSEYDWAYPTTEQPNAGGRSITWPRGKLLGGSSAINGLYWVRPSKTEIDGWAALNSDDPDAAKYWSWDALFPEMKKSETFNAPEEAVRSKANIQYNPEAFGTDGPIHIGYPGVTYDIIGQWTNTLQAAGVPTSSDPASGNNLGSFIATSNINKGNWTRSTSRTGYIDTLPPRRNLAILTGAHVTRIVWDDSATGDLKAVAVEYAASADSAKKKVNVKKEVILAGGSIGSPQILQLSGVGPEDVLKAAGVEVKLSLPGVGAHLQDHLASSVIWQTDAETAPSVKAANDERSKTDEFLSFVNSATAYVDLKTLIGENNAAQMINDAKGQYNDIASKVPGQDPTVMAGHKAMYELTLDKFWGGNVGQVEILLTMVQAGSIIVQAAIQHPLSWGRLAIKSNNAFDYPDIDPQYLAHPSDRVMMREGLKFARLVGGTSPLKDSFGRETFPGDKANDDAGWDAHIPGNVNTEYHPSSTAVMLPKNLGGVIDARLKVYGTANVRVADSAIFPFSFSCHLAGPTFAVAEQAANIIRAQYTQTSDNATGSPTSNPSADPAHESEGANNGAITISKWTSSALLAVAGLFLLL